MKYLPRSSQPRTIAEWCEQTQYEPDLDTILAASILQAKGWIFGIHFDASNALDLCKDLLERRGPQG